MTLLLVAVGGAAGAMLRYLTDRWVQARLQPVLPVGTLLVNAAGSLLLGMLAGASTAAPATALIGTGFCGALTTYSTFGYETMQLLSDGARRYAILNVALNVVAGLAAAYIGLLLTTSGVSALSDT